ncbi:MAG: hypothetical protein ACFFD1_11915 [Candidatus Thorarchaeota archaeon]
MNNALMSNILKSFPELKDFISLNEENDLEITKKLYLDYTNKKYLNSDQDIEFDEYIIFILIKHPEYVLTEKFLVIASFLSLYKGKIYEYQILENKIDSLKNKSYHYGLYLVYNSLFEIIFTGNNRFINENTFTLSKLLENSNRLSSQEHGLLSALFYSIQSYLSYKEVLQDNNIFREVHHVES